MTELCSNRASKKRRFVSRRDFLFEAGEGISGLALIHLLNQQGLLAAEPTTGMAQVCMAAEGTSSPLAAKPPHFKPRAKSVISLFMSGGYSHVDTFDPKPMLDKYHGQPLTGVGEIKVRQGYPGPLMRSPFQFKKYGQSGIEVSEIFPHIASIIDEFALIRSCTGKSNDHVLSHYEWNTGSVLMGFPSVGAWVTYGLGTGNQSLPAFVVMNDAHAGPYAGPQNWSAGFLPAAYQGTVFRARGDPILDLAPPSKYVTPEQERTRLDLLSKLNQNHAEKHPGSTDLAARIASYELAYRMQGCAPEAVDISKESEETKKLYGLDDPITAPFAKECLMARRLVERGVRFIQLFSGYTINTNTDTWDAHVNIVDNHTQHAAEVDKPVTGLIANWVTVYKNFFQPTMKLAEKVRAGRKIHRKYDEPKTPYQRLIESGQISAAARKRLTAQYESLNVAQLRRQIEELRNRLFAQLENKNCAEPRARKRHGPGIRVGGAANAIWMRKMMKGENQ